MHADWPLVATVVVACLVLASPFLLEVGLLSQLVWAQLVEDVSLATMLWEPPLEVAGMEEL